jgi:uncharacterized protein with WD repeat
MRIWRQRKAPVQRAQYVAVERARYSCDPSHLSRGGLLQATAEPGARIGVDPVRNPLLSQAKRDFLPTSDRARCRASHRRPEVIAGLLALTMVALAAAGIAMHDAAHAIQRHTDAKPRQTAVGSLAIDPAELIIPGRLTVAAWRIFPADQTGSGMTTVQTEQQESSILLASSSGANGVVFSSNGKLLASAYADGTVRLWNPVTGQPVGSPLQAGSAVNAVAFSPDGKLLASADADGAVRLWNPVTGQPVGSPLQAGSAVNGVAFSPDGKLLASADADGAVRLWNPVTGQPVGSPLQAGSAVNGVAFSPDGKLLISADANGSIRAWNTPASQPADSNSSNWFIIMASVIAIVVSALTITITTREIRLARIRLC